MSIREVYAFQSLVGTLKTDVYIDGALVTDGVSIPRRYAKNGVRIEENSIGVMFQLVGR